MGNRIMTIDDIFLTYVMAPPVLLARMNRTGRAPREDQVTKNFVSCLERKCITAGMPISEFRKKFRLVAGCYPEYSLGGISLSQAIRLCSSLQVDPTVIIQEIKNGEFGT